VDLLTAKNAKGAKMKSIFPFAFFTPFAVKFFARAPQSLLRRAAIAAGSSW
jgi:hypothetical protein